jgi:hypothetical protein
VEAGIPLPDGKFLRPPSGFRIGNQLFRKREPAEINGDLPALLIAWHIEQNW